MPNPTQAELIALATSTALRFGLSAQLVCGVVEQESAWEPWAIRYEPGFYDRYIQPLLHAMTLHNLTEARAEAFSWGLMQMMGRTARNLGFTEHLASLCAPEVGLHWGCLYLSQLMAATGNDVRAALLKWNGGGNAAYPDQVMARMSRY